MPECGVRSAQVLKCSSAAAVAGTRSLPVPPVPSSAVTRPDRRLLFILAAAVAVLGGALTAAADGVPVYFVVNVSSAGFDPPVCRISRGDIVAWRNVGPTAIRIVLPNPSGGEPLYDSGLVQPGETSRAFAGFISPNHWNFQDAANAAHVGVVITPVLTNNVDPQCSPTGALPVPPLPRGPVLPSLASDR